MIDDDDDDDNVGVYERRGWAVVFSIVRVMMGIGSPQGAADGSDSDADPAKT